MNRFVFSSVLILSCVCIAQVSHAATSSVEHAVGVAPKVLQNVRNLPKSPFVRVLIAQQKPSMQVEVHGAHNIYDPYSGKKLEAAFSSSAYQMQPTADGIKWGQEFPGVYQILIVPDTRDGTVTVNGIQYAGAVAFYEVGTALSAVAWSSLEDFTSSMLSSIMPVGDIEHKEALAAMAIAIRSLAYQQLQHSANQYWDIRADACGYKGRAVVRLDVPFQEALRLSKNIILGPQEKESPVLNMKELDQLKKNMPYQQAVELANNGKDASHLLEKFMPGRQLISVEKE